MYSTTIQSPTAADYSDGKYYHYAYDSVGNRLAQETSLATDTYSYDDANRLTSVDGVDYIWDSNGNLLNDSENTYAYDSANRLTAVSSQQLAVSYAYNGLGDRLQQTVDGQTMNYTLDLNAGLTQVLDDGTNTYLYGSGRIPQTNGSDTEYFLNDALGSVRQLTDAGGAVTLAKNYDPFGDAGSSVGAASTPYGFTGEQTDPTGMVYLRARYYDPGMGRFMTRDTWGGDINKPMSYNAWLYVYADPIIYSDPNGQFASEYLDFSYDYGYGQNNLTKWSDSDEQVLDNAARSVGIALANVINNILVPEYRSIPYRGISWIQSFIKTVTPLEAFEQVYGGKVDLLRVPYDNGPKGAWAWTKNSRLIWIYTNAKAEDLKNLVYSRWLAHELGHAFESTINGASSRDFYVRNFLNGDIRCSPIDPDLLRIPSDLRNNRKGLRANVNDPKLGYWQFNSSTDMGEVFADMYVAWTYDNPNGQRGWATQSNGKLTEDAVARSLVMNTDMPIFIDVARWRWYHEGKWR